MTSASHRFRVRIRRIARSSHFTLAAGGVVLCRIRKPLQIRGGDDLFVNVLSERGAVRRCVSNAKTEDLPTVLHLGQHNGSGSLGAVDEPNA